MMSAPSLRSGPLSRVPLSRRVLALAAACVLACAGGGAAPTPPDPNGDVPPAATAAPTEERYAASEILVAWKGSELAPDSVTRTEPEAHARAVEAWRKVSAGEPFDAVARATSDAPSAPRGGSLGTYRTTTLVPAFESAVAAVAVGEITRPFATPYGWHVVRRDAVVEIAARHVLVSWSGAWRSASTRSRADAEARAEAVRKRLEAGEDFARVAKEMSDDATATVGGDLGTIAKGQLVPAVEDAAFALPVGGRSTVIESPYGFHVIERTK